ncbi:MAG TPA: dTMP kinase, partial [Pyrodictium sp.]|nr:dTMP kinase [Pyrodictium sp.]
MGLDGMRCRLVGEFGALVAVEGIDGAGLTTHSRLLVERLSSLGLSTVYAKEPTRGPVGLLLRRVLSGGLAGVDRQDILAFLFMADRFYNLYEEELACGRGVLGCILNGYIVVLDRYKYSSLAYQTSAGRAPLSLEEALLLTSMAPPPHVLVYLDVEVGEAIERIKARREELQLFEKREQLEMVKKRFEEIVEMLSRKPEYCLADGQQNPPWAQRGWPIELYPKTHCYPATIAVKGGGRTVESVSAEIVSRVLEVLERQHV